MEISRDNVDFSRPGNPRPARRQLRRFFWLAIVLVVVSSLAGSFYWMLSAELHAQTADRISYGSRAGMEITITDRIGIGTSGALIAAKLTRADAAAYCKQYVGDASSNCIDKYLADTHLSKAIGGNCDTGVFMNFYSEKFRVEKRRESASNSGDTRYRVFNVKDGSELDDSMASGLSYNLEQFYALCPQWKLTPPPDKQAHAINQERFPVVLARGLNGAPGAIVCNDFASVGLVFRLFNRHWEDSFQEKLIGGQAARLRGPSAPAPDPESFGCKLVKEGTSMWLESQQPVPTVSFEEDGMVYRGVTMPVMIQSEQSNSRIGGNTPSMLGPRR